MNLSPVPLPFRPRLLSPSIPHPFHINSSLPPFLLLLISHSQLSTFVQSLLPYLPIYSPFPSLFITPMYHTPNPVATTSPYSTFPLTVCFPFSLPDISSLPHLLLYPISYSTPTFLLYSCLPHLVVYQLLPIFSEESLRHNLIAPLIFP